MDIQKVTTPTEKTKAPGRVAWGKKLAEMRRQKKQKPITQLRVPSAQVEPKTTTSHGSESSSSTQLRVPTAQTLIGLGCLALGAGALYYQYRTYWLSPTWYQSHASPTPVAQVIDKAKDDNPLPQDDKAIPKPSLKSRLADMM